VRLAFGADGEPDLLSGTSGGVWRVGMAVLKRTHDAAEAAACAAPLLA
jgi:hypothetical protein